MPHRATPIVPFGTREEDPNEVEVPDLAKFLRVGENMIREACRTGRLKCVKKANGDWLLEVVDVLAWLRSIHYANEKHLFYLERIAARSPTQAA